jgi:hypothetical protein
MKYLKSCLPTNETNAAIDEVVIDLFSNDVEAETKLKEHVKSALLRFSKALLTSD